MLCLAFSLCPSPPPSDDAPPPPAPEAAAALARASLFPPANALAPPLNLPVRVLQVRYSHRRLLLTYNQRTLHIFSSCCFASSPFSIFPFP